MKLEDMILVSVDDHPLAEGEKRVVTSGDVSRMFGAAA